MDESTSQQSANGSDSSSENRKRKRSENVTETEESVIYGYLVLLGYQGPTGLNKGPQRRYGSKYCLRQRSNANGVKPGVGRHTVSNPKKSEAVNDRRIYSVSYAGVKATTVVPYEEDVTTDLYQIGRLSESAIDFTVVGRWEYESADTTISRYACRIQIDRRPPHSARLFAAGFDGHRNIFLGDKATTWTNRKGDHDGFTTNGVLILHPAWNQKSDDFYAWREVSVGGSVHEIRPTGVHLRYGPNPGKMLKAETNELRDGSLIDICGATLLFRTVEGLLNSPSKKDIDARIAELNAGKPLCPVKLTTLYVPKGSVINEDDTRMPFVYVTCGHVQSRHGWGAHGAAYKCPLCTLESTGILPLSAGQEAAFHYDNDRLTHAFNPCGHLGSEKTVKYWARIPMPSGGNLFAAHCPFCSTKLDHQKPFVRLHFQDDGGFEFDDIGSSLPQENDNNNEVIINVS